MHSLMLALTLALVLHGGPGPAAALPAALPAAPLTTPPRSLSEKVQAVLAAPTDADCEVAIGALTAVNPDWKAVAAAIKAGPTYPSASPGWREQTVDGPDNRQRPWALYVPPKYSPKSALPVLIALHGMVSTPKPPPIQSLQDSIGLMFKSLAEDGTLLLAVPAGDQAASWFDENGAANQLSILRVLKERFNVNENAVFVTGFSDGGSGAFYMALNHATPLAGAIALNGWVVAAQAKGVPACLTNLVNVPLYVVNTGRDPLYPPEYVQPFIDALKTLGANVTFKTYAAFGHDGRYWGQESAPVAAFIQRTRRNPLPARIDWETADPGGRGQPTSDVAGQGLARGRCRWLEITRLGRRPSDAKLEPVQVRVAIRPTLGLDVDASFRGGGVKVNVQPGSVAAELGLKAGDVIVSVDGKAARSAQELAAAIAGKKPKDPIAFSVRRGTEESAVNGVLPEPAPRAMLDPRGPRGRVLAEAAANRVTVTSRGVTGLSILVSPDQFDLGQPIEVTVNGAAAFKGRVTPDVAFMLRQGYADRDRRMVFVGKIDVTVPE